MTKPVIKVNDNGSLRITGDIELIDAEGNVFQTKQSFSLCRCGLSKKCRFATVRIRACFSRWLGRSRRSEAAV